MMSICQLHEHTGLQTVLLLKASYTPLCFNDPPIRTNVIVSCCQASLSYLNHYYDQ